MHSNFVKSLNVQNSFILKRKLKFIISIENKILFNLDKFMNSRMKINEFMLPVVGM